MTTNGKAPLPDHWAQAAKEYRADREHKEQVRSNPYAKETFDVMVDRLTRLPSHAYDVVREIHAQEHNIRVATLDKAVAKRRKKLGLDEEQKPPPFATIEQWHEPVTGADILADIARVLTSHVILPAGAATAIALWTLHAHTHDSADISPILGITSPTPECGKTTLLTFLGAVVPRPLPASNITSAALFRAVEKWHPTLLVDEADTFLRDSDELRGVVNSGHNKANAYVIRTVGDDHEPCQFKTWAPKAIACIGRLAPTLASRSLHIELRRKGAGEQAIPLRPDRMGHLHVLARKATRWAADHVEELKIAEPNLPSTLSGRQADNWRHMLAIADLAGGVWPARARKAAEAITADDDDEVASILLLQDIRAYFEEHNKDRVLSLDLVETLHEMIDRPWTEWGKNAKLISETQVAKLLKGFQGEVAHDPSRR